MLLHKLSCIFFRGLETYINVLLFTELALNEFCSTAIKWSLVFF